MKITAKVIKISRTEAKRMLAKGTLPTGHATLEELTGPNNRRTVYHIEGTPPHDYRIRRKVH